MNRRKFIKQSALISSAMMLPGFLRPLIGMDKNLEARKLVVVQLSGGNDGLNTIIPFRNDLYYSNRSTLAYALNEGLKITSDAALNPALSSLQRLYLDGKVCIVNGVGYPNPDRSHFRSMDIWHTASSSSEILTTGWLGRYLDSNCNNCHVAHHAIEVDDSLSLAMKGAKHKGMAMKEAENLYRVAQQPFIKNLCTTDVSMLSDNNLGYLYKTLIDTEQSASYVYEKIKTQKNVAPYSDDNFNKRMSTIGRFILSGLETQVYYVSLGSFDTHANQKQQQERLLQQFAEGVASLMSDIEKTSMRDEVLIMVFSEFGRRVSQNAGNGTDHGTAGPMLLIGHQLKSAGMYNPLSSLNNLSEGDLVFDIDFRSVYATILKKWLQADHDKIISKLSGVELLDIL